MNYMRGQGLVSYRHIFRNLCANSQPVQQEQVRLSKAIAATGMFSRREAEKLIVDGRVRVNFDPVENVASKVGDRDKIFVDDIELKPDSQTHRPRIWLFHKVRGELVAGHDAKNRPLMFHRVKQLVGEVGNLTAVNKLEMNSEGLLLLTNNNLLAKVMEDPSNGLQRKYRVRVHGKLTPSKLEGFTRGIRANGVKYRPIHPTFERTTGVITWLTLETLENRTRFLRNSFEQMLLNITRVISTQHGPYSLPTDLPPGSYREVKLTPQLEKLLLKEVTKKKQKKNVN